QPWEEGIVLGHQVLERYRVLDIPRWQEAGSVRVLSAEEKQQLSDDLGELLLLLAGAAARQAKMSLDAATRQERLAEALHLNARAEECYPLDASPRALWRQRAELARLAGHAEEAQQLFEK